MKVKLFYIALGLGFSLSLSLEAGRMCERQQVNYASNAYEVCDYMSYFS